MLKAVRNGFTDDSFFLRISRPQRLRRRLLLVRPLESRPQRLRRRLLLVRPLESRPQRLRRRLFSQ